MTKIDKSSKPDKILVSWISYGNDFNWTNDKEGKRKKVIKQEDINIDGPTFTFHREHYENLGYNEHKIFCLEANKNEVSELIFKLEGYFPEREGTISSIIIPDTDAIDSSQLFPLVSSKLLEMRGIRETRQRNQEKKKIEPIEIDALFSTGTPAMQITWAFCKFNNLLNKLYQTRRKEFIDKEKKFEGLVELSFPPSNLAVIPLFKEVGEDQNFLIEKVEVLKQVYQNARIVANSDVTVLIHGESGTGKENLAQTIHKASKRREKPFISINCAALGDSLLESRLFGYVKGAFNNALKDTEGYFDAADSGTIFMDEIGDISKYMQQILLRVLQNGDFSPVGSPKVKKTNVRIVVYSSE